MVVSSLGDLEGAANKMKFCVRSMLATKQARAAMPKDDA